MGGKLLTPDGDSSTGNGNMPYWARIGAATAIIVIAMYLVFQQNQAFNGALMTIRDEQRIHILQTNIYQRAICLSLAKLAATDPVLCEPPK